jgi:hypothetical protein
MTNIISQTDFHLLARCLIGKPIGHAWRGYGTAIFLEFGQMNKRRSKSINGNPKGEATAMLEWDWRVESLKSISFGSGSGKRKIENGLKSIIEKEVKDVYLEGRLPELVISLSGNKWVHTFSTYEGHPQWTLFMPNGVCLSSRLGHIEIEPCSK